ncbi:hypothetical protein LOTGIDRAFT_120886 [Lottia gigantea]|uniref:FAD dependent oxidoreductase domain-containing protein n=1 Tax=Lottia gigantea TaxID=225164 RepID=V4BTX7_LOTGI|nr:hypothetical protein LOTGIDRAFT_120886 [Lottia gigantea]ESO92419.1 hypothetical protein LOTGIDRAFT_120886 [Lottia gigantea]
MKVCVVGAGVIGLSSAIRIQEEVLGCDVTLIADRFSPDTTFDGAGGMILVFAAGTTPVQLLRKWSLDTKAHLESLTRSAEASEVAVHLLSGFQMGDDENKQFSKCPEVLYGVRDLSQEEKKWFPSARWAKFFTSIKVDCTSYLAWLKRRFERNGGKITKKKIHSLSELSAVYDIIVNCTGLNSIDLIGDKELSPTRGETIRVKAPWIKHFYANDESGNLAYVIPGSKNVVLGGTYQEGNWNMQASKSDSTGVWERCLKLVPSLKNSEIDYHWVGLRPTRTQIRLELDETTSSNCPIIHNYGHGGSGVTLHWGCAGEVVKLVNHVLVKRNKAKL